MQADPRLYVMHVSGSWVLIVSTHVDYVKGGGKGKGECVKRFIAFVKSKYGKLVLRYVPFKQCGALHFQDAVTYA
eukprot:9522603-Heterocapsa_arctica.AAC.1